jgi:hypothetical protein
VTAKPLHPALKVRLGYEVGEADADVLRDWRNGLRRVCKPCWELKYCPYGPLVEQSPTIPTLLNEAIAHNEYFKRCLETNLVGNIETLSPGDRTQYETWMEDEQTLLKQARYQLAQVRRLGEAGAHMTDEEKIAAWIGGPLPPIHIYRTSYEDEDRDVVESDFSTQDWSDITKLAAEIREQYRKALETGTIDDRSPLEPARAA